LISFLDFNPQELIDIEEPIFQCSTGFEDKTSFDRGVLELNAAELDLVVLTFTAFRQIPTPTVPNGDAEKHFYKHYYKGIFAAAAGDFKTAAIAFSKAQPQDFPQMIPHYDLTAKRSIEIIQRVERGLLDKRAARHLFQGLAYYDEINEAVLIHPIIEYDSYFRFMLSFSDRRPGAITSAAAEYKLAIEIEPDFAEAHNALADIHALRGSRDEMIRELEKAIKIQPDYAEANSKLAGVHLSQGKVDEAIARCQKVIEIRPGLAMAHFVLGGAYLQKGMLDEAIIEYRTVIKIIPDDPVFTALMDAYKKNGMNDEAKAEQKRLQNIMTEFQEQIKKGGEKKKVKEKKPSKSSKVSEKERLKQTTEDMFKIATAIADYITDNGKAPTQNGIYSKNSGLYNSLSPFYIKNLPIKDLWGNNYLVYCGKACNGQYGISGCGEDDFVVVSYGPDRKKEDWKFDFKNPKAGLYIFGNTDHFAKDLILWNRSWIRAPRTAVSRR
jgi:tetratricopeptide (TPR) repeat protein